MKSPICVGPRARPRPLESRDITVKLNVKYRGCAEVRGFTARHLDKGEG
jgi:hypothetical protein